MLYQTETDLELLRSILVNKLAAIYASSQVDRLFPEGTRTGSFMRLALLGLSTIAEEGFRSFLEKVSQKIVARHLRTGGFSLPREREGLDILRRDSLTPHKERLICQDIQQFRLKPKISIVMPVYNTEIHILKRAIDSVRQQLYDDWELCICDDGSEEHVWEMLRTHERQDNRVKLVRLSRNSGTAKASNEALRLATGEYVALLDHDDMLAKDALYEVCKTVNSDPSADILYSDEDKITEKDEHYDPFLKPDWSPELLRSIPYMAHLTVIRKSMLDQAGCFDERFRRSPDYYLQLTIADKARRVAHIPRILYSWRAAKTSVSDPQNRRKYALLCKENLKELSEFARRMDLGTVERWMHQNTFRIRYRLTNRPLVTIVIPTFDRVHRLQRCLASIEKSVYQPVEVIIVTNNLDDSSKMRNYLSTLHHRIVVNRDEFSWSEMNNTAAEHASGEYLLFLNDDTEVITVDWIENMLRYAQQHDVGAVGCRLLFPDGSCQHAGVTADPVYVAYHQFYGIRNEGYYSMIVLPREVSAVTGACMMVRREVFQKLGGFHPDLKHLYSDTDFCWKLGELGYRIVYDPATVLYHHEGSSRYGRINSETVAHDTLVMLRKWRAKLLLGDPFHNYNLVNTRIDHYGFTRSLYPARTSQTKGSVLLVSHNLNLEGAPLGLLGIARHLKASGYGPAVLSPHDGKLASEYARHGIPVIIVPDLAHLCWTKNDILKMFMASFDVIIVNTILMYFIAPFVKTFPFEDRAKTILIVRESGDPSVSCRELGISLATLGSAFKSTDKVVFVSAATQHVYERLWSMPDSLVIHDGIESPVLNELMRDVDFHLDKSSFNILTVGTIYPGKGQDILIEAVADLLRRSRIDCRLYLVGKAGDRIFYEALRRKVREQGLDDRIIFTGELEREEVFSCYSECDVFVLPSRQDSFPTTILEAMAFGKPIIAANVFGVPEQIEDEVSGLLIGKEDRSQLFDCILQIYHDRQLAATLGRKAQQRFLEKFQLENMGRQYEHLLETIVVRCETNTDSAHASG